MLANAAFLKTTGYTADEVIGRNCRFLQGSDTDRPTIDTIRSDVESGRESTHDLLNDRKDGTPFWNWLYFSPVFDDDGKLIYFFASSSMSQKTGAPESWRQPNESCFVRLSIARKTRWLWFKALSTEPRPQCR